MPTATLLSPTAKSTAERMFLQLTPAQIARVAAHGRTRTTQHGEVLLDLGDQVSRFLLVVSGQIESVKQTPEGEQLLAVQNPGQFTGELNLLSGRRALARARVRDPGELIVLEREELLRLVQSDFDLGEILMRAFILRRVALMARGLGDVVLIGSDIPPGRCESRSSSSRNAHPYTYLDLEQDADVQHVLDRFQVSIDDIPVLICRGELVLRNPRNAEIAECLGLNEAVDSPCSRRSGHRRRRAVGTRGCRYRRLRGPRVLVLKRRRPVGKRDRARRSRTTSGFRRESPARRSRRARIAQAQKFGAQVLIASGRARKLTRPSPMPIERGSTAQDAHGLIASGAEYRKPSISNLSQFEGAGVYYAATFMESQLCGGEEVIVIGGGNSAGQAAVFLAQTAQRVHILVARRGLADTMSRYLVRRIEETDDQLHTAYGAHGTRGQKPSRAMRTGGTT